MTRLTVPLRAALLVALALLVAAGATVRALAAAQAGRERTVFVSAVDDRGEPVEGLGPDAFLVREDGVRREVLRVSRATEPMDVALLVDNSAASDTEITFIRDALGRFVTAMTTAGHQVAIVTLADRPTIRQEYTADPRLLAAAITGLFAMPGTGMTFVDGVYEASRGLERREAARAAIVAVITDGTEFANRDHRSAIRAMQAAGVSLHPVTMGRFEYVEEHNVRERTLLLDLGPKETGGAYENLLSPHGLTQAMERLARQLTSQYRVVYGRPDSLIPPDKVEVASARAEVKMRATPSRAERTTR